MEKKLVIHHPIALKTAELTFNSQFEEAKKVILERGVKFPRESLEYASIQLSKSFISAAKEDKNETMELMKKTDSVSKEVLKSNKKLMEWITDITGKKESEIDATTKWIFQLEAKLVYAEAIYARAIMQMTMGSYIKGGLNFRNAWKQFTSIQKEIDSNPDAVPQELKLITKHNIGVFYFWVSFSPGNFLRLLELLGFVANRDLGIQYLREVAFTPGLRRGVALLFLLFNYLVLPRGLVPKKEILESSESLLNEALTAYPNSAFYLWLKGVSLSKHGNIEEAIQWVQKAIKACSDLKDIPIIFLTNLAVCHYMASDWKSARDNLELVTNDKRDFEMKGLCGLQLAVCYHLLGEEEKAQKMLDKVPSIASKHSRYDKVAVKRAASFKKRGIGLGPWELLFVRRDLHHLNEKQSKNAIKEMDIIMDKPKMKDSKDNLAAYYLMKAVLVNNYGDTKQAKELYEKVIELEKEIKEETWVLPGGYFDLAEIAYFEGDTEEAERLLKIASKFNNYDFQELAQGRINLSLQTIKKERKAKGHKTKEDDKEEEEEAKALEEERKQMNLEEDQDED